MMRIIDRSGRERLEPDGYILQDGESYRVPMMFIDNTPRPRPTRVTSPMRRSSDTTTRTTRISRT